MTTLDANEIAFFFSPFSGGRASGARPVAAVVAAISPSPPRRYVRWTDAAG